MSQPHTRRLVGSLLGSLVLTVVPALAEGATISSFQIAGATTGCFGASCSTFADIAVSSPFTFDGTSFDVFTDSSGTASGVDLGDFSRLSTNAGNFTGTRPFALLVSFSLPLGISGSQSTFDAVLTGQVYGGGGSVWIDFDNTLQTFSFANLSSSGSFQFGVMDVGANVGGVNGLAKGGTTALLGQIRNAAVFQTPDPASTAVPEPTTLLLLGTGLATLRICRRKRT